MIEIEAKPILETFAWLLYIVVQIGTMYASVYFFNERRKSKSDQEVTIGFGLVFTGISLFVLFVMLHIIKVVVWV